MPRAVINLCTFLQEFNPSKFIVYSSLLTFSVLFSLRLDKRLSFSYWLVFLPLWVWKSIAILGALVGSLVWIGNPDFRISNASYIHFKSMLISLFLQLLLLMFEILVCDKLESRRHSWILAFTPLIFVSLLSISVCVWSIKNGRGIELEFFAAVNILQFILIALRLDNFVDWSWIVVFVPSWILLCFIVVIILYAMIFAAILLRSPETGTEQRRASVYSASSWSMIFLPILMFMILLTSKLDTPQSLPTPSYLFTFLPLFLALLILIRLSFGSRSGSLWWFGMRSDFCTYLLIICPCLKEYGNTSFTMSHQFGNIVADSGSNLPNPIAAHQNASVSSAPTVTRTYWSENNSRSQGYQPESGPKRILHSLSHVFSRNKLSQRQQKEEDIKQEPIAPKLNIDSPD